MSGPESREGARSGAEGGPLAPAEVPVGPGAITAVGVSLAVVVAGLGVVGLQAAASAAGLVDAGPWLTRWVSRVDGVTPRAWVLLLALLLVLAGVALLLVAVRPRPKKALTVSAQTGVFIGPHDLARLVEHAADDVDGVLEASVHSTTSRISVRVGSTGGADVEDAVGRAIRPVLDALDSAPRTTVLATEVHS